MRSQYILIVDDEEVITSALAVLFQSASYETAVVHSGTETLKQLSATRPDLIVLDVMMPDLDGYEVCRQIRQQADYIPILMLTAKDESWEKVIGLELGADVYLTKPFESGELLAQVKALLRLVAQKMNHKGGERPLTCGSLDLWQQQCRVFINNREISLSPQEYKLLQFLMQHPYQVFGRETLLERVWGYDYSVDSRTVDTHMQRLRNKIERNPAEPQFLQTVRGFGYRLVPGNTK